LIINVNYPVAQKYGWFPEVLRVEMEDDKERRPALYKHKWLGEPNTLAGKIYTDWDTDIDEIPKEAKLVRYGLDFGYSIDPTVILAIYRYNGMYILDEVVYQKGLSNRTIADILLSKERCLVVADSAEPKSIDEIRSYGITIVGAKKGAGSVNQGIQWVQELKIGLTRRSVKTRAGYLNYKWATDRDEKVLNVPDDSVHEWSNPMDAARYGLDSFRPLEPVMISDDVGGVLPYLEGLG
jgi:phage terminase large subunit